jgi:hypothetical protein
MNNKQIVGGIFCDLEKAFDSVNHNMLLSKLEFYGITGNNNVLYKSNLQNRYQRVSIYDKKINSSILSSWAEVKHGIPQGSIIGPLSNCPSCCAGTILFLISTFRQARQRYLYPLVFIAVRQ